jgi:hypothetical protein
MPRKRASRAHHGMSILEQEPTLNGDNPFKCLSRGVESDVLCVLGRSRVARSGSEISTITDRSRSQIQNVLRYLAMNNVVISDKKDGWWFNALNPDHPLEPLIRQIAEMRLPSVNEIDLPSTPHALDAIDE